MVSKKLENQKVPEQSNFKQITKKSIQETRSTIDHIHDQYMTEYSNNMIYKTLLKILKNEIIVLKKCNIDSDDYKNLIKLYEDYEQCDKKNDKDMSKYLLNLGKFLTDTKMEDNNNTNNAKNGLSSWLESSSNKGEVYKKFLEVQGIDLNINNFTDNDANHCYQCNCPRVKDCIESTAVCPECGDSIFCIEVYHNSNVYQNDIVEIQTPYAYKRMNHFNEWLAQFQGLENTTISNEIINAILGEMKKMRIDKKDVTSQQLKLILKKIKMNKYYEHIPHIMCRIKHKSGIKLDQFREDQLRMLFQQVETTFIECKPNDRKNFLSYSYVLHKLFELLGDDEYLEFFPLLKSRDKLYQQDIMWKAICDKLRWQYIPSI